MACELCRVHGARTHSFDDIGYSDRFGRILYTNIAKADDYSNTKAITEHLNNVLSMNDKPWCWIFDCNGIKMKHTMQINVAIALSRLILEKFSHRIQRVILINPPIYVDTLIGNILPMFNPESIKLLNRLNCSPLELYLELKKIGFDEISTQHIVSRVRQ